MVFRSCGRLIGISADFRSSRSETRFLSAPRAPHRSQWSPPPGASELRFMTTLITRRFPSRAALDAALAERLAQALAAQGPSAVMLAGGTTPLAAYRSLAEIPPPHDEGLHIVRSEERRVGKEGRCRAADVGNVGKQ